MTQGTCKTIKVCHEKAGFMNINEADFDPKIHKLYEEKKATKKHETKAEEPKADEAATEAVKTGEEDAGTDYADQEFDVLLKKMSEKEIDAFAKDNDIELKKGLKKDQKIVAILAALNAAA